MVNRRPDTCFRPHFDPKDTWLRRREQSAQARGQRRKAVTPVLRPQRVIVEQPYYVYAWHPPLTTNYGVWVHYENGAWSTKSPEPEDGPW